MCPSCGERTLLRIVYGLLPPGRYEDVILGGCVYSPHFPDWGCVNCGAVFRSRGEELIPAEPDPHDPLRLWPWEEGWHKRWAAWLSSITQQTPTPGQDAPKKRAKTPRGKGAEKGRTRKEGDHVEPT